MRRDVEKVERKEGARLAMESRIWKRSSICIEQSVERLQVRETDGQRVARIRKQP